MPGEALPLLLRPFRLEDIYRLNEVNLDAFTENFSTGFYWEYLARWPELCVIAEGLDKRVIGYILGRFDGEDINAHRPIEHRPAADVWHGHVSALSVAPAYRGKRIASALMDYFERMCYAAGAKFIDLYVRQTNTPAIQLYQRRDYVIHQTLKNYYNDSEDGLEMRLYPKNLGGESVNLPARVFEHTHTLFQEAH